MTAMTALRVFHIPSQLSYVSKLAAPSFTPVPSPTGAPLTVAALLARDDWHFFDVLHVHTVELAAERELRALAERLRAEDKGLVATVHDLAPNIETDQAAFDLKTGLLAEQAAVVFTLTAAAADRIQARFGRRPEVVPHGYAVSPDEAGPIPAGLGDLLMFGALRPNRRLTAMVRAWRLLPAGRRPLRVVLRSVGPADRERSAADLAELAAAADTEPETDDRVHRGAPHLGRAGRALPAGVGAAAAVPWHHPFRAAGAGPGPRPCRAAARRADGARPADRGRWPTTLVSLVPGRGAGRSAGDGRLPRPGVGPAAGNGRPAGPAPRAHGVVERHRSAYRQALLREWVS